MIEAEGDIVTGTGGERLGRPADIYSDDVADAFYDAVKDKDVKAIVFRVSSPGGSDTASEQILAAVRAAKAAGKPVVVSMGTYGASGGYWISSEASAIVAEPSTLTGSIGVFGGKFALGPALAKFGVDVRQLGVGGDYADAFGIGQRSSPRSSGRPSPAWMDRIYDDFVARVADGRKLPPDRVREIAKGHVWTGAQAKELGLVDELGGFYEAVDKAKALAGITGEARLKPVVARRSPFEAIQKLLGVPTTSLAHSARRRRSCSATPARSGLIDELATARLRSQGANLLAPVHF